MNPTCPPHSPAKYRAPAVPVRPSARKATAHRSASRARTKIIRYAMHNRLILHVTLTYGPGRGGLSSRPDCIRDAQAFLRRMRLQHGRFPWLYVLEQHPGEHGWHVHLLLPAWPRDRPLAEMWKHGQLEVKPHAPTVPLHRQPTDRQVRDAARWLGSYLAKDWNEQEWPRGQRHYVAATGFAPPLIEGRFSTEHEALRVGVDFFGRRPDYVRAYNDDPNRDGPPLYIMCWNDPARVDIADTIDITDDTSQEIMPSPRETSTEADHASGTPNPIHTTVVAYETSL